MKESEDCAFWIYESIVNGDGTEEEIESCSGCNYVTHYVEDREIYPSCKRKMFNNKYLYLEAINKK